MIDRSIQPVFCEGWKNGRRGPQRNPDGEGADRHVEGTRGAYLYGTPGYYRPLNAMTMLTYVDSLFEDPPFIAQIIRHSKRILSIY